MPNPVTVEDFVTVEDLQERFPRPFSDAQKAMAPALLLDAWEELQAPGKVPDLEDRMTDGRVREGLVRRVVSAMVNRVLSNPEAVRQWQVDDASFTRDSMVSAGLLYASAEEIDLLGDPLPATAFTIRPGGCRR